MSTLTRDEKILDYIEVTGALTEKMAELVSAKEAQDNSVQKLIPLAVTALLDNERIEAHEKEAAAEVLKNPVQVLEILIKTARHRNDAERSQLGKPTATKQASDGFVGNKKKDEPESSKAYKRALGF
jgi:hypothetical protein